MSSVDEILRNHRKKQEEKNEPEKVTISALALLWKKRMAATGTFQHNLTAKEMGQLKLYLAAAGPLAYKALDHALQNWGVFAFEAKAQYGLSIAPEKPVVGFVLKYYDVALQLVAEKPKTFVTKPTGGIHMNGQKEVVKIPVVTPPSPSQEGVSADTVWADIQALKAKKKGGV